MTFLRQAQTMFGGSSESEICDEIRKPHHLMLIQAAACDPRLPRNAMGYIDQLQRAQTIAIAEDAANQIRKHIPDFFHGIA